MAGDIYYSGQKIERSEFDSNARRIAANMNSRGIRPDDAIAILLRNDVAFLEIIEACRFVGARFVTINWHAALPEIVHILEDSQAKLIYAHTDLLAPIINDLPESVRSVGVSVPSQITSAYGLEDQPLSEIDNFADIKRTTEPWVGSPQKLRGLFAYTSGSTGRPKGIKRHFDPDAPDMWDGFKGLASALLQLESKDRLHVSAPLYHSAPIGLTSIALATEDVDIYLEAKFEAEAFLRSIEEDKLTHAYVVPTMMVRLLKLQDEVRGRYDTSTLRFAFSTGSAFPADMKAEMISWFGSVFFESYGASEIGFMTLISSDEALRKPGSVGQIISGGAVKVLDDNLNQLAPGEIGTLYVHLPQFSDFKYTNSEGDLKGQRSGEFTSVGDMGYVDEDQYIYITGRKKDMIISGGANIFPPEIEAQLILIPEISDCAVFGVDDEEFGERIVAAITCQPGQTVDLAQIREFLLPRLAKFKIPREVQIHDELPRQDSGKIFKEKLRAQYRSA